MIIKSSNNKLKDLEINSKTDFKDDKSFIAKDIENFEYSNFKYSEDIDMAYAYYKPSNEEENEPLVIWLHGGGEGGKDSRTILLANKASLFSTEELKKDLLMEHIYICHRQRHSGWKQEMKLTHLKELVKRVVCIKLV